MALTLSQTMATLAALGHHPKKHLGQNYLVDPNIVAKSLQLAALAAGENVVEVGPGLGTLTESLLERGAQVWAVEWDARMVSHLRHKFAAHQTAGRFDILAGDAVEHPRAGLPSDLAIAGFKVIANLPYAISTPWLDAVLMAPLPQHLVLMLQREAADRFAARPGSKQFGAISIFIQSAFDILPGHRVSPTCFHPRPEVDSYLFNARVRTEPFIFSPAARQLIRGCFQQRRKQIGPTLKRLEVPSASTWIDELATWNLDHRARPEQIPLAAWQTLAARAM